MLKLMLFKLLVMSYPVAPSAARIEAFYDWEDECGNYGAVPDPLEVHEWDVEFWTKRYESGLLRSLVWKASCRLSRRFPVRIRCTTF